MRATRVCCGVKCVQRPASKTASNASFTHDERSRHHTHTLPHRHAKYGTPYVTQKLHTRVEVCLRRSQVKIKLGRKFHFPRFWHIAAARLFRGGMWYETFATFSPARWLRKAYFLLSLVFLVIQENTSLARKTTAITLLL